MPSHSNAKQFAEMTLDDLAEVLSLTIKHDKENKIVTFLAMLSAFTGSSQINVSFNAPSSSGKTYLVTEIAELFPVDDRIQSSGASPSSFLYGESDYDEERKAKIVNLERKILIFYEQPNPDLQARLRPVLSHDQRELVYRMTNKGKKGENRAEKIIIRGFPATVFCSAGLRLNEQEATRAILLSPEVSDDKLQEGIHLQALRSADPSKYQDELTFNLERVMLMKRIAAIKDEAVDDILIPDPGAIEKRFKAMVGAVKPRHMRDIGHLMKLIKAIALLNMWHRYNGLFQVEASPSDIDQAFNLWSYFLDSQNLNIPPVLISFYKKIILPAFMEKQADPEYAQAIDEGKIGVTRQELAAYHFKVERTMLNDEQLRKQMLPQLENSGLIQQQKPLEGDKRSSHIIPQWFPTGNNIGTAGVTSKEEAKEIIDTVNKIWPN